MLPGHIIISYRDSCSHFIHVFLDTGQILTKILELLLSIVGIYSIVITLTFICIQIFVYRKYCRRQHKNDQGAALNRERVFIDKNNFYNKSLNNYSVAR